MPFARQAMSAQRRGQPAPAGRDAMRHGSGTAALPPPGQMRWKRQLTDLEPGGWRFAIRAVDWTGRQGGVTARQFTIGEVDGVLPALAGIVATAQPQSVHLTWQPPERGGVRHGEWRCIHVSDHGIQNTGGFFGTFVRIA